MTRKEMLTLQATVAHCISHAADRTGKDRDLRALTEVIARQEKEHRAFGVRLVGRAATKGRATLRQATDHFVCKVICEGVVKYGCGDARISTLEGVRQDYVMGAIMTSDVRFVTEMWAQLAIAFPGEQPRSVLERAASVDYMDLIAPKAEVRS